ncbi:hypothetical protein ACWEQO_24535 [Streptomyces sp. NPDC004051]
MTTAPATRGRGTISFFEIPYAHGSSADDGSAFAGPNADTHWFTP